MRRKTVHARGDVHSCEKASGERTLRVLPRLPVCNRRAERHRGQALNVARH
ncbi:AAEL000892-PA [Aedes aegypti]|uniref:AAEL000892-PA n=1 Tax=Aedes aegypti TaxID=7159 RepID=Q17MX0_AEDAE|nr:AAEL000892-PA [Aedes aegypti]